MVSGPPKSYALTHRLEYAIFSFFKRIALRATHQSIGKYRWGMYFLLYHVLRICRRIVKINLDVAFPDYSPEYKRQIAKANYHWSARATFDILQLDRLRDRAQEFVQIKNLSVLDDALKENNGVLLVSGHFGNWEIIAPVLAEKGYPMVMYVGGQTNPLVDAQHNQVRQLFGVTTISKSKMAAMQMSRTLAKNQIVCMLVDQNDRKGGLFVNFFGKPASMNKGMAMFYMISKSPIILVTCPYVGQGMHMDFQKLHYDLSGDRETDVQIISQTYTSALEEIIRQYPEQYFWMHRRWRTRPPHHTQSIY